MPPFTLFGVVYLSGLAFLPSTYNTMHNWKAAAPKYLYMDSAYGLWPQFILASCVALRQISMRAVKAGPTFAYILLEASILWFIALCWQGFVTGLRIRSSMLDYDYIERPEMFGILEEPSQIKMLVVGGLGIPLCVIALSLAIQLSATALAAAVHFIRQ